MSVPATGAMRLTDDQADGAAPGGSAWMSASAGTGKTQVLTARVLRLMLEGADPASILCITFTKAGAAEMARRIRERLARWVQADALTLQRDLFSIHVRDHMSAVVQARARTLFAEVIDAPGGGLAIQTIHAFAQALLAAFPEEAGLAPGFQPLDDAGRALLEREVLLDLMGSAAARGDTGFLDRIGRLAIAYDEGALVKYLKRCIPAADRLDALPAAIGPWLRGLYNLPQSAPADWLARQCDDASVDVTAWRALAAAARAWSASGAKYAQAIDNWLARDAAGRAASIAEPCAVLFTKSDTLRKDFAKPAFAAVADRIDGIAEQLRGARDTAQHMIAADRAADGLEAGRVYARAVALRKERDGVVDFDDLIERAVRLLASPGRAEWIRYKLDTRIDHILVDEAQDTNAAQWLIVGALAEEFFVGEGLKGARTRTLFVVGDLKQAIFGFQGTNPEAFEDARRYFRDRAAEAGRPIADIAIDINFRSSAPILDIVDRTVAGLTPGALGLAGDTVAHQAQAAREPGRVLLWPPEPPGDGTMSGADDTDSGGADAQADAVGDSDGDAGDGDGSIDNASRRLADKIARSVAGWLRDGIDGQPVRPADIMVLLRSRTGLARLIVSRLQAYGVPIAGVDRLQLQVPIAVKDLLAAARFALQPLDDLNLANLLVSPLCGWSHAELADHGWRPGADGRAQTPLWPHLRANAALDTRLEPLRALLRRAGFTTPSRFFETILSGPMQGRARLIARLGNAARDPIEELLNQAMAFEAREGASLHRFLHWFDTGEVDIKRSFDSVAGEVRVMTVHGAKGLEAPIVILADASAPINTRLTSPELDLGTMTLPVIGAHKGQMPPLLAASIDAQRAAEAQEHYRLLYVAMTRAERMLCVAGKARSANEPLPADSWYAAIAPAVEAAGMTRIDDPVWGPHGAHVVGRWKATRTGDTPALSTAALSTAALAVPGWVAAKPPVEARPARPLAPSALGDADAESVAVPPTSAGGSAAAARGRLMHQLFERLPAVPSAQRHAAATRWLAGAGTSFDPDARAAMVADVLAVLDNPDHAALFGAQALPEVPFSALVDGRVIAGTIDRLLVTAERIAIVDFKTGAAVPASADAVPPGYLRQMAAYAAALAVIYPGRAVTAALLYTSGPALIALPPALLAMHAPVNVAPPA